jgi:hypothetical protein
VAKPQTPEEIYDLNTRRAERVAWLIVIGLGVELVGLYWSDRPIWEIIVQAVADLLIAGGVGFELVFARVARGAGDNVQREARKAVSEANARAAEANKVAEEERHARAKLESQLQSRTLSQEQWDMIQGLRGKFRFVSLVHEADFEAHWYANQFAFAFNSAGIGFAWYRRAADVHTAGIMVYDPHAIVNPDGTMTSPDGDLLASIFTKSESFASVMIFNKLPTDVSAPHDLPALIIGGRTILPLSNLLSNLPAYMTLDQLPAKADPANETKKP